MTVLVALIGGYAIGSIPFAFLVASRWAGVDVRQRGSGNVGAANVYRTTRPSLGIAVFILDFSKGIAVVAITQGLGLGVAVQAASALAAIVGHVWPVWLGLRGGKGVATAAGAFVVLAPVTTLIVAGIFVLTVAGTRYVSLGSVLAAGLLPMLNYLTAAAGPVTAASAGAAVLIIGRHRSNLSRLRAGTEPRLGERA